MRTPASREWIVLAVVAFTATSIGVAADSTGKASAPPAGSTTTAQRGTTAARSSSARGPLPDPTLLDGSAQQADKKTENGMLGEFEIPGDENVRNGKVGGPQNASQEASEQDPSIPQNGGSPQGTRQGGTPAAGMPQGAAAAAGGAQAGGPPPPNQSAAGGGPASGDPNASADGVQVGQLTGEAGQPGGAGEEMPPKPGAVAIGDSAMQIKGVPNPPGVVGAQQVATQTQQMEKAVGGGGKGASGNNGNRGAEKGRVMPSGL